MVRAIWTKYLQTASVKRPQRHSAYEGAAILKEKYDHPLGRGEEARCRGSARRGSPVGSDCPPLRGRHLPSDRDYGKSARSRKTLDLRREKEIAAFERWQRSVPRPVAEARRLAEVIISGQMEILAKRPWALVPNPKSAAAVHSEHCQPREAAPRLRRRCATSG
jgi:hypothetical protein